MKILATFDESPLSEATIPALAKLAALPNVEVLLRSVLVSTVAIGDDAVAKRTSELEGYLERLAARLPTGPAYRTGVDVAMLPMDAATVLIERARSEHVDLIVMATHGRSGVLRVLLGSVADNIVRSGVAPVLLVRPLPEP
jgi:nucleotide-binding universal stress UspA family protein